MERVKENRLQGLSNIEIVCALCAALAAVFLANMSEAAARGSDPGSCVSAARRIIVAATGEKAAGVRSTKWGTYEASTSRGSISLQLLSCDSPSVRSIEYDWADLSGPIHIAFPDGEVRFVQLKRVGGQTEVAAQDRNGAWLRERVDYVPGGIVTIHSSASRQIFLNGLRICGQSKGGCSDAIGSIVERNGGPAIEIHKVP